MTDILAAVMSEAEGKFAVLPLILDDPQPHEVLVRLAGVGICHTDLAVRDRYYPVPLPLVMGHEGSGIVERVGAQVTKVAPGDAVVLTFMSCGVCKNCRNGDPGYCDAIYPCNFNGARADGSHTLHDHGSPVHGCFFGQSSFATYALASERNVVKVPGDLPLHLLGPLGCGVQTGAGSVMNALKPQAGSSIAIFGAGSVGLSAVMAARIVGCSRIIAVDINPGRLELAVELGATHTIDPTTLDAVPKIHEITGGGADFSLDTTALPLVARQAVEALNVRGECGLVGAARLGTELVLDMNSIFFGRSVRGIIEGEGVPDIFIPQLLELYRQGRFPFDRLIKEYPLAEINQAVADTEAGLVVKPVLIP